MFGNNFLLSLYEFHPLSDDQHIMASASIHGDIALWDLDKRKLVHVMRGAHDGFIPSIQFLNGQPILVSSGADNSVKVSVAFICCCILDSFFYFLFYTRMYYDRNSTFNGLKQWIFDSLDGLPRLLKLRSGHHAPPHRIRYYGDDGHIILSAASDRSVRVFSTVRDSQSTELSQGM